jgi:murein DD-endopeptidase MepM/ murein hydrolase activator NlpD
MYTITRSGSTLILNVNGDQILCFPSSVGEWSTDPSLELTIRKSGNQLLLLSGPQRTFAVPVTTDTWIVDGQEGPGPEPGTGDFSWPFNPSVITYEFRPAGRPFHNGIDFSGGAASSGHPIPATGAGVVHFAGVEGGYGNSVVINHGVLSDGATWYTRYGHAIDGSIAVSVGDPVIKGQTISAVGNTGNSFGAHLHWETLRNGTGYANGVNPRTFLAAFGDGNVIYP